MDTLTKEKEQLELTLSEPATYADPQKFIATENRYKTATAEWERMNDQYEKLFEQILALEAQQAG